MDYKIIEQPFGERPKRVRVKHVRYPFASLTAGQGFIIETGNKSGQRNCRSAAAQWNVRNNGDLVCTTLPDGSLYVGKPKLDIGTAVASNLEDVRPTQFELLDWLGKQKKGFKFEIHKDQTAHWKQMCKWIEDSPLLALITGTDNVVTVELLA